MAASAAAAAPQALAVDAVASAVMHGYTCCIEESHQLCFISRNVVENVTERMPYRITKLLLPFLEALRRGELNAPSSEAEAGLLVYHFSVLSCLTRVQLVYCNF